jgi:hypothetical protein
VFCVPPVVNLDFFRSQKMWQNEICGLKAVIYHQILFQSQIPEFAKVISKTVIFHLGKEKDYQKVSHLNLFVDSNGLDCIKKRI